MNDETKPENYKTKFRLLTIISLLQTILLWYIIYIGFNYHFSTLENILIISLIIIFYIILFAKKQIQAFINKLLDW